MGHPFDVEHASALHVEWCKALLDHAGLTTTHQSGPQMRAVMLELRASLAPSAVLVIANQLPALERGIFLDQWSLDYQPDPPRDADEFHDRIYQRVKAHHAPPASITADVFWLLREKLEPRKAEAIREQLPPALLPLWPQRPSRGKE